MTIAIIILFILVFWEGSVMSRRTKHLQDEIDELKNRIEELAEEDEEE